MSDQRFTNVFREALWETYHKKCFYCGCELRLADMRVDHVLPEALAKDYKRRDEIIKHIGIKAGFDILGFENLAPSCSKCNSDKGQTILPDGSLAIFLSKIRDKIPALDDALQKQRSSRNLESTLRLIARSVDSGNYTYEELERGLEFQQKFPNGIHGSSPAAPPRSPEYKRLNMMMHEPSHLIFTEHALQQLHRRDLTLRDIYKAISVGIHNKSAQIKREPTGRYVVLGKDELRIVFEIFPDRVLITSVFNSSERSEPH